MIRRLLRREKFVNDLRLVILSQFIVLLVLFCFLVFELAK